MADEHDPRWEPSTDWVPVTRWKESLLMWVIYLVGGAVIGVTVTAATLYLLSLLGVPI